MDYEEKLGFLANLSGNHRPCFVFSVHKAGSTLLNNMIREVCSIENIPSVSIPDIVFSEGLMDSDWRMDKNLIKYFRYNILYYGFRYFPELLNDPSLDIRNKKFVLLVRDPRDALVSQYFSFGGRNISHVTTEKNQEKVMKRAMETIDMDIDEYVLYASEGLLSKLDCYKKYLDFNQGLILKYEDIYYDKLSSLQKSFSYLGFDVSSETLASVAKKNDIRPEKEDITQHIRKGDPGDHRTKLKPETIEKLSHLFFETGKEYGYDLADF